MANILVVDDDSDIVEISRELLESAGHKVMTARNGVEGLRSMATGHLPDCVLLDVDMPVLTGPQMVHRMLLHDAGEELIPILLVSGREDLAAIADRLGTPYFLEKRTPEYGKALLRILARALAERHSVGLGHGPRPDEGWPT